MNYGIRWRRAIMVSVVFHIFFLTGAGYVADRLFTVPAAKEQYVELDLVNEPPAAPVAGAPENPNSASQAAPTAPVTQPSIFFPQAAVSADNMSMAATEVSARSDQAAGSTTGSPVGNSSKRKRGGMASPGILAKVEPVYPQSTRQAAIEGTVVLKVQILENGRPGNIILTRSSGSGALDEAAIAAVRQWRFTPAQDRDSGQAVACYTTLPVSFHLN